MTKRFKRVFILGIDGVPHSLIQRFIDDGIMPHFAELAAQGQSAPIDSVLPTVSNVAWAGFQTGKNPGKFDIFGFAEVDCDMRLRLPNASDLRSRTIQELVCEAGRRVISLGVPGSYPPRTIHGIQVGGFLAPSLAQAVHPPTELPRLERLGYGLDVDPVLARRDLEYLKATALALLEARRRVTQAMLSEESWDLFILHVMETDRVNHFMWRLWESGDETARGYFEDFYRRVDDFAGWLGESLGPDEMLIIMSDHGFCGIRHEVELNRWLMKEGYLRLSGDPQKEMFAAVSDDSVAFALVPGRIHLLRREVFGRGGVDETHADATRDELIAKVQSLADPQTGAPVCRKTLTREAAFSGPYTGHGPDIVVDPNDGYDLKASLEEGDVFSNSPITGMHTYHDAHVYVRDAQITGDRRCIIDVCRTVLEALSVPVPEEMDSLGVLAGSS